MRARCLHVVLDPACTSATQNELCGLHPFRGEQQDDRAVQCDQAFDRWTTQPGTTQPIGGATAFWAHYLRVVPKPLAMYERQHVGKSILGNGGRSGVEVGIGQTRGLHAKQQ